MDNILMNLLKERDAVRDKIRSHVPLELIRLEELLDEKIAAEKRRMRGIKDWNRNRPISGVHKS